MARSIAVADCETDPFKIGRVPQPFAWGFYDGSEYHYFDRQSVKEWIQNPSCHHDAALVKRCPSCESHSITSAFVAFASERHIILYAHNGGKFDWHFVLPFLTPYDDLMIINGRIAKANLGNCEIRDSYNIIPVPLAAYEKEVIDYAIFEPEERIKPANRRKILDYLKSDCVNLYDLISKFVASFGVQITLASAAMKQWKTLSDAPIPNSTKEFYDLMAPYYYGGRVECFESGIIDTDFHVYDLNSAYPDGMCQMHPYSTDYSHFDEYVEGADFYKVRCISKGVFPFRGEGNPGEFAGLRFPRDNVVREYTVTGWEYVAAVETKAIRNVEVLESFVFSHHVTFKEYIDHFYALRMDAKKRGDKANDLFAKTLMNGLYGKWAANPDNYRNYMIVPMDVIGGLGELGWSFAGEMGPWALAEAPLTEEQLKYYNVATGASITGYVRAKLWRAIASSNGVLYCDTDSIAVRQLGKSVDLGDKLGQWKFEGSFNRAGIAGKKLYIFEGQKDKEGWRVCGCQGCRLKIDRPTKHASKGARLSHRELWEVAGGKVVLFRNPVPTFSVNKAPKFTDRKIRYTAKHSKRKGRA